MSDKLPLPSFSSFPRAFGQRDAKIMETLLAQSSHSIKKIATGVAGSAVSGVAIGDLCIQIIAASGLVDVQVAVAANTVPQTLLVADYILILRAN